VLVAVKVGVSVGVSVGDGVFVGVLEAVNVRVGVWVLVGVGVGVGACQQTSTHTLVVRTESLDQAVDCASREAAALGDVEIDVRPVTEPWDIAMMPKPAGVTTRRFMTLRKATAGTEAGASPSPAQRAELARLIDEGRRSGTVLAAETMRPSARGRRYKNARDGVRVTDGPFTESKELIAGYVIVSAASLEDAGRMAERYLDAVEADEVDVRELEDGERMRNAYAAKATAKPTNQA